MKKRLIKGIKKAGTAVSGSEARELAGSTTDSRKKQRSLSKPLASRENVKSKTPPSEEQAHMHGRKSKEFVEVTVTGSKGQKYQIVVPTSYKESVPKTWKWNAERYRVAELIAMGVPIAQIPDDPQVTIARMTIYCWLEHPEFREHVDGLTMETGFANKRERIAQLNRLTREMFNKVIREMDALKLTDKSVGAFLTAIQTTAKLLAQEKEEFVEESKVTSEVDITGTVVNVEAKLNDFMQSKSAEERRTLEQEFDAIGNDIIRSFTGSKD